MAWWPEADASLSSLQKVARAAAEGRAGGDYEGDQEEWRRFEMAAVENGGMEVRHGRIIRR